MGIHTNINENLLIYFPVFLTYQSASTEWCKMFQIDIVNNTFLDKVDGFQTEKPIYQRGTGKYTLTREAYGNSS